MDLAERIAQKRQREGLSLREAGERSGVAFSTLGRIEAGATPSFKVAQRIEAWLTGEEQPLPPPMMSLRDWFAGQAMVGCIMDRASWGVNHSDKAEDFARYAYDIADAMLAEREKANG